MIDFVLHVIRAAENIRNILLKTASPDKERQLYQVDSEIKSLEYQLERLKDKRNSIIES